MIAFASTANAQLIPDIAMEKDFNAQVKSVDEFIQRFNGMETHPDIKASADSRTRNLVALFDYKMNHKGMSDSAFVNFVSKFVKSVEEKNVKISLTDADMYAVADIKAAVMGKSFSLKLTLQSQTYNNGRVRWAIVGVDGLFNAIDTTKYYGISPVEHETHFMGLGDIFKNNSADIIGYRGKHTYLDELSVFLGLTMAGKVDISEVSKLTIHCLSVPDYAFTINEQGRGGRNSGWLISSLTNIDSKKEYIINKLHIK